MQSRGHYWFPGIIFLLSLFLHLALISKGPVTVDCLNLAIQSKATLETHQLHYLYGSGYPLMVLMGSIFIFIGKFTGITDPVLAVNYTSVLFSSIAIFAFFLLVKKLYDDLTAVFCSLILLFDPIFLDVSTYGINHAPALCFFLLGLLSLQRFQDKGIIRDLMISALFFGLMGATRLQDLILTSPCVGYMLFAGLKKNPLQFKRHKPHQTLIFMTTAISIILFFHLPYFLSDHKSYDLQAENFWKIGFMENFRELFSLPLKNSILYLIRSFSIIGAVCFFAGFYFMAKSNKKPLIFIILWISVPLMFYGNAMTSAPRFFNIIIPAVIIPIGVFLAQMIRHKSLPWVLIILASYLIMVFQPLLYTAQTFKRRHQQALISDYYTWVGKITEPDAVIVSSDDEMFITYYSKRDTLGKPARSGHILPSEFADFKKKLDKIIARHKPVYISAFGLLLYDNFFEFRDFMRRNYLMWQVGQMPLELWYETPFKTQLNMYGLIKISQK